MRASFSARMASLGCAAGAASGGGSRSGRTSDRGASAAATRSTTVCRPGFSVQPERMREIVLTGTPERSAHAVRVRPDFCLMALSRSQIWDIWCRLLTIAVLGADFAKAGAVPGSGHGFPRRGVVRCGCKGGATDGAMDQVPVCAGVPADAAGRAGARGARQRRVETGRLWGTASLGGGDRARVLRLPPEGRREVLDVLEMCVRQGLQCPHGE